MLVVRPAEAEYLPKIPTRLAEHSSKEEIISSRDRLEIALAGLGRVSSNRAQYSQISEAVFEAIGANVHTPSTHESIFDRTQIFRNLRGIGFRGRLDRNLNPYHLGSNGSVVVPLSTRCDNINFINRCLRQGDIGETYLAVAGAEEQAIEISDDYVDLVAINSLVRYIAPRGYVVYSPLGLD